MSIDASAMKLKLESGRDSKDQPKYSTRTFKDINAELSDEDMLAIGTAMAALQSLPLGDVVRTNTDKIEA